MPVDAWVEAFLATLPPGARRKLFWIGVECSGVTGLAARLKISRHLIYRYLEGSLTPRGRTVARLLAVISECPVEKRHEAAEIIEAAAPPNAPALRWVLELLGLPSTGFPRPTRPDLPGPERAAGGW